MATLALCSCKNRVYTTALLLLAFGVVCAANCLLSYLSQDTHLLLTGGIEKILRIFDLNRPDVPPREVDKSPGSVRTVAWLHSDQTILSSCTDIGGVRYVSITL